MNAHLPALQKVELVDLGAVLAGRFCLGVMGERLRVAGGNFLPPRSEGAKKWETFRENGGRLLENALGIRQKSGRLRLRKVSAGTKFFGKGIPVLWKTIPVLWKAIPVLGKAIPVLWKVISVLWKAISVLWKAIPVLWKVIPVLWKAISVLWKGISVLWKAIPVLGKGISVLWKAIPVLGKATPVLWEAKTDRCSLINALFFPTNFPPLNTNQT